MIYFELQADENQTDTRDASMLEWTGLLLSLPLYWMATSWQLKTGGINDLVLGICLPSQIKGGHYGLCLSDSLISWKNAVHLLRGDKTKSGDECWFCPGLRL